MLEEDFDKMKLNERERQHETRKAELLAKDEARKAIFWPTSRLIIIIIIVIKTT